jgi:hypothetical protein
MEVVGRFGWPGEWKTKKMKRFVALQGCVAVFSAFLLGPFTHVHQPVDHHDHAISEEATIVHSHVSFDAPELAESSESTISRPRNATTRQISAFDFQKASAAQHAPLIAVFRRVPELVVQDFAPEVPDAVAHAPPQLNCIGLRSPPA